MLCVDPRHLDAAVVKRGSRTNKQGIWQRFTCTRPDGSSHWFQTLSAPGGSVLVSNAPPPPCPEHLGSKVIRRGKHKHSKAKAAIASTRQRYLCRPADGSPQHRFVPSLPREVVDVGDQTCDSCEELLSPHRGEMAVARRSHHSLKAVVQCLNDLAGGATYAQASIDLRARTQAAVQHRRVHHYWLDDIDTHDTLSLSELDTSSASWSAKRSKNGWRLAADLTEQYSPALFGYVADRVKAREAKQRAINDEVLAADPNAVLGNPLCYVLDELPVVVHRKVSTRARYQQTRWHLLVVTEVRWHHSAASVGAKYEFPPMREAQLRLVRAYPGASEAAWRLVLDELAVRPDFVVSDFGSAITNAVKSHYAAGLVGHVPSFFHMARNIRTALLTKPNAMFQKDGHPEVLEDLEKYLDALTRQDLVLNGRAGWSNWWDKFLATLNELNVPVATFTAQRRIYEEPVAAAFPLLRQNPHLPASNAAVESKIRMKLEPLMENRKQRYRNIARINALMDLVVCREQGLFLDLEAVGGIIRGFNDEGRGWAPKSREICDVHPSKTPGAARTVDFPYSSLLDPYLTEALYQHRKATG